MRACKSAVRLQNVISVYVLDTLIYGIKSICALNALLLGVVLDTAALLVCLIQLVRYETHPMGKWNFGWSIEVVISDWIAQKVALEIERWFG